MRINEGGMIEIIRYRLPIYWACALINGDYSGLSEEEIQEIWGGSLLRSMNDIQN